MLFCDNLILKSVCLVYVTQCTSSWEWFPQLVLKKTLHTFAPDYELRGLTKIGVKVMGDDNKSFPVDKLVEGIGTVVIIIASWLLGKKKI